MMSTSLFAVFALMTALAALAVLWPLSRARPLKGEREADLAVYRDQLAEIDRDRDSGRLATEQAEAARAEVARRMLAADTARAADPEPAASPTDGRRRAAAVLALVLVPLLGAGLYLYIGSPGLPGAPLAERMAASPDRGDVAILVRRVEEHLAAHPDDSQGYEVLAPIYLRLGQPDDAARAYGQLIRIQGPSAELQSALGEALVLAANGIVTADAAAAFQDAVRREPTDPRANYFLGLAAEQDGRGADAARIWSEMVARAPADAPYLPQLRKALARVQGAGVAPASGSAAGPAPGPSAEDVANAASMSTGDRSAMIRGMVQRLEDRLKESPDDLEGWLRLARAFKVLGEPDKAKGALQSARAQFGGNAEAVARIDAASKDLALGD
ncbi:MULTISPECIES: c-type cytochrome biogenesis protein CcmI [unclassified Xanthobacter]|uniref:c-type cytochrome biogenesis protein CcmI n=1 Tax=unclassified Xanthobacter TaxID=2623496 RepID=UPI001EDD8B19|nr:MULTISPECIES: c-type cytochrome biogenesis protein CcmI [unclassified Xanthobacter]